MPLPESTMSEPYSRTVLQVCTGHNAEHLRPGGNRSQHSAHSNITSKTSKTSMPLPQSTTSAARRGIWRGTRKLLLPPLLPFTLGPPVQDVVGDPPDLMVRATLRRHCHQRVEFLLLLPLVPLLLLLLLRLGKQRREEEGEGASVDCLTCRAGQKRNGQQRHWGSHVTDRDCPSLRLRLCQDAGPLTSPSGGLLSP